MKSVVRFPITEKEVVRADEAAARCAQAAAAQWDPATAIDWAAPITHPPEIEDTVVQVMTFLIENETAALIVPASFLAKIHFRFREVSQILAIQAADEARHVAFGLAHLRRHLDADPGLRPRLASAVERRHDALHDTAGLNEEVFDALVVLAAGSWVPAAIASGHERVVTLQRDMDQPRRQRLRKLGFAEQEADALSALHTRYFM